MIGKAKGLFIGQELQDALKACDDRILETKYEQSVSYKYETVIVKYNDGKRKIINVTGCSNILTLVKVAEAVKNGA